MTTDPQTLCRTCMTPISYIDAPTGGWWVHETHPADEHDAVPGGWVDGDELMEAIAAEVWEHCAGEATRLVVDDPRNIAGTAAAVARRLRAVPSVAAELANLRAMYDAVSAREHELIEERDKLVRWHGEDEAALKEMRATIERLRTEKRELGELAARRESELIHYRKLAAKTPAGRAELRDRIAEALYAHSHPGWATRYADLDRDERETYLARADAVLAVLPPSVDRGAAELASLAVNAGRALSDEKRHYQIACEENGRLRATIDRVRRLHDNLDAEIDLASPDDAITRGAAARKIAAALDGWTDPAELRRMADEAQQPETREVVHACPPDGSGLTPCCGRTPFELPRADRMSSEQAAVTCTPAVVESGKEA